MFAGNIWVKIGQIGHGENFPGARHDHQRRDSQWLVLFHGLGELGLHDMLHTDVESEDDVQSVAGRNILTPHRNQLAFSGIRLRHQPPARAGEFAVHNRLHALFAFVICAAHEA